jgi:hypothetical protein
MTPTPEGTARAKKAWETIRRKQAQKQAEAGAVIAPKGAEMTSRPTVDNPEFDKFDTAMRAILSVSKTELQKREKQWKRKKDRKKPNKKHEV